MNRFSSIDQFGILSAWWLAANGRKMQQDGWTTVDAELNRLIGESGDESFDENTITNARTLISFARKHCRAPEIGRGYWPTICFCWATPAVDIEVFADRYEVYRFFDRRTNIREVRHAPGNPLPEELVSDLSSLVPS